MCAALEQYPQANVYNRSSQSEKKQKQLMQQIIKTMGRMKYVCDHFKISVTVRIAQTQEKHKRGIWDVENFKVLTFSMASYETEIYPIKNNIFCINSFRARNPIMPCNYWMWISCDHFDAVEWMCAAAPLSFSSRISYMHACMCIIHLRGKR